MLNSVVAALLLASSASRVAAGPVESRHMRIARGYAQDADILEDYTPYHVRYLALDCQDKHNTTFFDKCCHPLLRWQKLSDRPKECTPSPSASASAVLAEPTAPVIDEDPIDDDCDADEDPEEECDDDTTTSAAPTLTYGAVTSTSRAQSHTPEPTSTKQAPTEAPTTTQPISTSRMITRTTRSAEPTTSADPTTYADPTTSAKPTTSAAPDNGGNNDGGKVITGGVATWFTQNGGTGACGAKHSDSDHIVAMAIGMYGDENARSKYCGKKVLITNTDNGKSVEAIIADCCPTCPKAGSLDLSTSAFAAIGDLNTGVLPIKYTLFD